ncbi:TPA: hypothetical protein RQN07_002751 [Aeromonas dhakensis]|uniref:P27 family phage terminase small subunit n=1 Tax=Aeromonas dhakensis TaxID=196024 RepID=UPI00288DB05C|nr:hypothetical protein [Aeromonas dhakensis]HDX8469019.1 hypothetical protein [Aeromonas dhakensis]HDZ8869534.1 hypothetical protein [Aeromonas dhakensis]HDZ8931154.1 hypothetical protein [Aeromonas dhakensis]HEA3208360.1 hypothetical protein [Aeromonas dhakensis]
MAKKPAVKAAPVSIMSMPPAVESIYKRILSVIKAERQIKNTEYGLVAQLASQYHLNQVALDSLINEGAVYYSTSKYGTVPKGNPQIVVYNNTSTKIITLSEKLLLSQKEMQALIEPEVEEDDDNISRKEKERQLRQIQQQ